MHWSARQNHEFRLVLGSFKSDRSNFIEVVELNESTGTFQFEPRLWAHHGYPATKVMFSPESSPIDLLATSSDALRLWRVVPDNGLREVVRLIGNKDSNCHRPLTSFDWVEPEIIGTCSIDRSCTIWNVERQIMEKQLIAHSDEVNDIAWSPSPGRFGTAASDGTVKTFDMRTIRQPIVVYENPNTPIVRVTWNKQDVRYLAALPKDSHRVIILDTRYPLCPVAELEKHKGSVNAMAWAPHSSCHICTAGDDGQALIWNLKDIRQPTDRSLDPMLSYAADSEILQAHWSSGRPDWIAICFDKMAQILRV